MNGPGPKLEGAALVIEPNEDYSFILEALEELKANGSYHGVLLASTGLSAFERVRTTVARLQAERDALETTIKRMTGQGEAALTALHAPKSEVNSQPTEERK